MPRWAEVVILLVVAFMAVIAILVFARVRHRESEELQRQTDLTLAQSQTIPNLPRDLLDVGPAAPRPAPPSPEAADYPERAILPPVSRPVAVADAGARLTADATTNTSPTLSERPFVLTDIVTAAAGDAAELADVVDDTTVDATEDAAQDDILVDVAQDGGAAGGSTIVTRETGTVEAGSPAELAVLRDAERTLNALYAYRLRADIPKALVQAEADRLATLLGRLPESTRAAVDAALEDGYRRLAREGNGPLVATPGAAGSKAMGLGDAEIGRGDPTDLRSFADRIRALERNSGGGAATPQPGIPPSPPAATGLPAAPSGSVVSPSSAPGTSPGSIPTTTPQPSSVLPAAAPSSLDGRLD
ncbi:MAG: hypothetical protein IV100_32105 [Myxococcales bacterium]|nr:hypothetical protein [Myxococcales bacterium]